MIEETSRRVGTRDPLVITERIMDRKFVSLHTSCTAAKDIFME